MHKIFLYIVHFVLSVVQADEVSGLLQAFFYISCFYCTISSVTWLTQFKDYRHDGHMFECPVSRLHLSISSSVSDTQIFLMNKLLCSFSLACASCDLDA
jgi:hypothetical protein